VQNLSRFSFYNNKGREGVEMLKPLETGRLILRTLLPQDFDDVHSYASVPENSIYMEWGPNTVEETLAFIQASISQAEEDPCTNHQYAAVLKETGRLIGACNLVIRCDHAEIGWILHRDYWKQGYGPEMGKAMLQHGFDELKLHRITARCDAENYGSYRVMEKIGMRREGLFLQARPANKLSKQKYGDELIYAILKEEWDIQKEMAYYNALPVEFHGFADMKELSDGNIYLVCAEKKPAIPEKKYVPAYEFAICRGGEKIGHINLRIGYTDGLYYGGQIGYGIDEKYRGNGYAAAACRLLTPVAKAHGMKKLLITNNPVNTASRRVCEKLGAQLLRLARLPEWHDLYKAGERFVNIFEWSVED
jgi:[ribosomal protein S5]-alanine N-acetyltransferase